MKQTGQDRAREIFDIYTRDFSSEDLQRLFTHDTPGAYRFFTRGTDEDRYAGLPWWKRLPLRVRSFFLAFTLRLPPARRILYLAALVIALFGLLRLFRGFLPMEIPIGLPFVRVAMLVPVWTDGTFALIVSFVLLNLLVLLEVADRLSLKGELEVAREIQLAMLPQGTYRTIGTEICGVTRPANTVGGDFYDVLTLDDGRVVITVGDVSGKGSPAALLMALLLAVLRTLVDERLPAPALMARLNAQICRHSPASRFITLFYGEYTPSTGQMLYVNAGHMPPLLRRANGRCERLGSTGVALGMFEGSTFTADTASVSPGDVLVLYSDGITEAEDPGGRPFEEAGLEAVVSRHAGSNPADIGTHLLKAVEAHARDSRFADDLTILVLKRT